MPDDLNDGSIESAMSQMPDIEATQQPLRSFEQVRDGVPPPAPTWGGMLAGSGRTFMFQGPWLALAPGLCLTVVVYSCNVFGDALRDLLDPRMRGSR